MAHSTMESVWKLMSEKALEVEPDLFNVNLTCGICKKLMIDACQTLCECQYCYRCLSDYLADGDKFCPGGKDICKEEKLILNKHVFKNPLLNKKILTVKVRCPNQSCMSYIVMTQLEDHLRICTKQQTKCPYVQIGCDNEGASKDDIVTHLQSETFTHSQLLIELIHNLKNEVDGLKDKFEISQMEISSLREELAVKDVQMREMMVHVDEQKRECTAQNEELKRELEGVKDALKDKTTVMTTLKEEWDEVKNEEVPRLTAMIGEMETIKAQMGEQRRELMEQMKEQRRDIKCLKEESQKKENVMTTLKEELGTVKSEMELRLSTMKRETDERETRMEVQRRSIDELRDERVNKLVKMSLKMNSDFVWRIDKCSQSTPSAIFSESFHSNNYKLCLSVKIWGDDIYLYCHILKGVNDDRVQWPMRLSITVSIVNRDTLKTHKSHTVQYDKYNYDSKSVFDRPKTERNGPICVTNPYYTFIKYSSIKDNKSITVDDSIIVSCILGDRTL